MEKLFGYDVIEELGISNKSVVFRGKKDSRPNTYIVKVLFVQNSSETEIARFKQEFDIIKKINIEGIVKSLEIIETNSQFAIIQEDTNGISLKQFLQNQKLDIKSFLEMGKSLSRTLFEVHKKGIVHKDIKPSNLIINQQNKNIQITDFGIAYEMTKKSEELYMRELIEGTLPYISPEQTGRTNFSIDYRTDIYSLGITFYEILIGKPPFLSDDPLEIVHAHIDLEAKSPNSIDKTIPKIISDIVMKMISKNPDERYQSSFGLFQDLSNCLVQLESIGRIAEFTLNFQDMSNQFSIPQNIIGRQAEIDYILMVYENILDWDAREINIMNNLARVFLVSGEIGIGKSSLVNEFSKVALQKNGVFIRGKFEQYHREMPYSAIVNALTQLVNQIICEGTEVVNMWKTKLLNVLGSNAKIITDIIPKMKLILGEQKDPPELNQEQNQNRFYLVFKDFMRTFSTPEHPLVLFLDDLQWADSSSILLIKYIIMDKDCKFIFIIGAYRDNEIDFIHPFCQVDSELQKEGIEIKSIKLKELSAIDVNLFISGFTKNPLEATKEFANVVYNKTHGNPFFMHQFLKSLFDEKLLQFVPDVGWNFNIDKMRNLEVTDNVVEMMTQKISTLPLETQSILKLFACMGNSFDLGIASNILNKTIETLISEVWTAISEAYIIPIGCLYQFHHDRIHDAIYSMIPKNEKEVLHYKIGEYWLNTAGDEEIENNVLFIVEQLNSGVEHIKSESERIRIVKLNLIACQKVKSTNALDAALKYIKMAIKLMGEGKWDEHYNLMMSIFCEAIEVSYLNIDFEQSDSYAQIAMEHVQTQLDKSRINFIKLKILLAKNDLEGVISIGLIYLREMGIDIPRKITMFGIFLKLLKLRLRLNNSSIDKIIHLPEMTNPFHIEICKTLSVVGVASYWSEPKLMINLNFEIVKFSLKHGLSSYAPFFFNAYALVLCSLNDIDTGYKMGLNALKILEKMNSPEQYAKAHFVMDAFIRHWKEHISVSISNFTHISRIGLETGDIEFSMFCLQLNTSYSFYAGEVLPELMLKTTPYLETMKKYRQTAQSEVVRITNQAIINLTEPIENPFFLKGTVFDEEISLPLFIQTKRTTLQVYCWHFKAMLAYIFNDYNKSLDYSKLTQSLIYSIVGSFMVALFYFFYTLSLLAVYENESILKKQQIRIKILKFRLKFRYFAKNSPSNHLHRHYLIEAEFARINNDYKKASDLYEKAVDTAKENKFINDQAISEEAAARFYFANNKISIAKMYIQAAYDSYKKWGASNKIRQLEKNYPHIVFSNNKISSFNKDRPNDVILSTSTSASNSLDISTAIKLSKTIHEEINLEKLLQSIVKLAVINAGGEKGYIILENSSENELYIESGYSVKENFINFQSQNMRNSTCLPKTIVNFVFSAGDSIVLNDALEAPMSKIDEYISKNNIKSVLCLPITKQSKNIGVIYIENSLITHAFTPDRLELLKIISSQGAISIENARLNNLLQYMVNEKTRTINLLLNNAGQGFLYFDNNLIINQEYSLECIKIFYKKIDKCTLAELLYPDDEFLIYNTSKILLKIFGESDLSKVNEYISELPQELIIRDKFIKIQYKVIEEDISNNIHSKIIMTILTDVTEKRELERNMIQSEKMVSLGRLVAGVAHEINTPVGVSVTAITYSDKQLRELMEKYTNNQIKRSDFEKIFNSIKETNAIVYANLKKASDLIISFKRISMDMSTEDLRPFNVKECINNVIVSVSPKFKKTNLLIKINCSDNLEILSYPGALSQIITNFLMNSVIHGYEPEQVGNIVFDVYENGDKLIFMYSDDGKGIEEKIIDKIFDPFFTTNRFRGSTGLGLNIVFNIVAQTLGGKIKCTSKEGKGTTFTIEFPIPSEKLDV